MAKGLELFHIGMCVYMKRLGFSVLISTLRTLYTHTKAFQIAWQSLRIIFTSVRLCQNKFKLRSFIFVDIIYQIISPNYDLILDTHNSTSISMLYK